MMVKEFIEKLQEMPQDLQVFESDGFEVKGCHIEDEFYNGDSANPECGIITVVKID